MYKPVIPHDRCSMLLNLVDGVAALQLFGGKQQSLWHDEDIGSDKSADS